MGGSDYEEFAESLNANAGTNDYQDSSAGNTRKLSKESHSERKKRKIEESDQTSSKSHEFGYTEIKKLEHCARTLQKNIRLLINEAPDLAEVSHLKTSNALDQNTKFDLENNELVRLSSRLRTKYDRGHLKIFDSIMNNTVSVEDGSIHDEGVKTKTGRTVTKVKELNSPPEKSQNGEDIPELPLIKDSVLYNRVFVHKSIINNKSYLHKSELMASHNERLEFLGDSILNNLVTVIIFDKFPEASEGELSKIRSLLVNNVTLAEFSIQYQFDKKLRSNINDQVLKDSTQKIYADIFEAYIGALAIERGYDYSEIQQWLSKLIRSRIEKYERQLNSLEEINKDAKSELYSLIGTAAFHPQYKVVKSGDGSSNPFVIRCTMGDDILGVGTAASNKDAGLRAAMEALKNKPFLEKYSQIRFNTDRNQSVIRSLTTGDTETSDKPLIKFDKSIFPLESETTEDVDSKAKNELYSLLGKTSGTIPVYETFEIPGKKFRAELKVKDVLVAKAIDISKKRATSRAAMTIMNNKQAIDSLCNL